MATIGQTGTYYRFQAETDTFALLSLVGASCEFLAFVSFPLELAPSINTKNGRRTDTRFMARDMLFHRYEVYVHGARPADFEIQQ
jgi:hypothetical protein